MYSFWETKVKYGAYTMEVDFIKQVTWWNSVRYQMSSLFLLQGERTRGSRGMTVPRALP